MDRDNKKTQKTKIGFITIGQSPRKDMTDDIFPLLSSGFEVSEEGALDEYSIETVKEKFAPKEGDSVLVTKMRNGSQVIIGEKHILTMLQLAIEKLEHEGNEIIVFLCTGNFPEFDHKGLVITPQKMLQDIAKNILKNGKLGLIIPDESQRSQISEWWGNIDLEIEVASPYLGIENIEIASKNLKNKNVDLIFMDCMGYTTAMKDIVKNISGKKVILPRTLLARVLNELI